jgi:hypothetical protein
VHQEGLALRSLLPPVFELDVRMPRQPFDAGAALARGARSGEAEPVVEDDDRLPVDQVGDELEDRHRRLVEVAVDHHHGGARQRMPSLEVRHQRISEQARDGNNNLAGEHPLQ